MSQSRIVLLTLLAVRLFIGLAGGASPDCVASEPPAANPEQIVREYEAQPHEFRDERLLEVAVTYLELGRLDHARPVYETFLRDHPSHTKALRGLGSIYYLQGQYDRAAGYLRKAWEQGDPKMLTVLGLCYLKGGKPREMEYLIPSLLEHKTDNPEAVIVLIGYVLDLSNQTKEPPDDVLMIKALDGLPDQDCLKREEIVTLLSEAVHRLGELNEANPARLAILRKISRGYESDPEKCPSRRRREVADSYSLQGEWTKAEALYRAVLEETPNDIASLRGLGIVFLQQRRFSESLDFLRKAWGMGDALALSGLATAHLALGNLEGMKDLVSALDERKKGDPELRNLLIMYALKPNPPDRELFYRAIQGTSDEEIVRRDDLTSNVVTGLRRFGERHRAERLLKLKKEQAKPKKA